MLLPWPLTIEVLVQQSAANHGCYAYYQYLPSSEWITAISTVVIAFTTIWYAIVSSRTLRALRSSSERQLRAYVLMDNVAIIDGTMLKPPQPARANIPGIALSIKNSGQTPAYKVVSWGKISVITPDEENLLTLPPMHEKFSNALGAGGTFTKPLWYDRPLGAGEIADLAIGKRAIYVYGRIEYKDAFDKPRFANFRLHYQGQFPPPPDVVMFFSENGNDAN